MIVVFPRAFGSSEGEGDHCGCQTSPILKDERGTNAVEEPGVGSPETALPVSVIVCFRNEAERLSKYLPLILEQDYPNFEVIAVDDFSTDGSPRVVTDLQLRYANLRLFRPSEPTRPGKKDALTFGIRKACHAILLLTDADCAPASRHWISGMTFPFQRGEIELVIGYSPYHRHAGCLNSFQRFETTYTAFQYLGLARIGLPYMAVGRNVAYRKIFFQRAGGLESHAHLPGGDDDLLVSHHARPSATAIVVHPAARTISDPATGWLDYWKRKMRHVGVGVAYPLLPKMLIAGLAVSHLLWYGLAFYALFQVVELRWWLLFIFLRMLLVCWNYIFLNGHRSKENRVTLLTIMSHSPKVLIADFFLCFYYLFTAPALFFTNNKGGWK